MAREKCYPTDPEGQLDKGARAPRARLCTREPWCVLERSHAGGCMEKAREPYERSEWDTRTPDPRGWAERKRTR